MTLRRLNYSVTIFLQWTEETLHSKNCVIFLKELTRHVPIHIRSKSQLRVSLSIIKVNGGKPLNHPTETEIERDRKKTEKTGLRKTGGERESLNTHLALCIHMWRQDEEREVGRCGSPSLPSSRITGVPSALVASSISSSERCVTITTLGQENQTSCAPPVKSNEEVQWRLRNCKNSYYITEPLSADHTTVNTSPTVGIIQLLIHWF